MNYKKELDRLKKETQANVYTVTAPTNDEETEHATIFLKDVDRKARVMIGKVAGGNDPINAIEVAINSLYIGGDAKEKITKNEIALLSCQDVILEMMETKTATLKKN